MLVRKLSSLPDSLKVSNPASELIAGAGRVVGLGEVEQGELDDRCHRDARLIGDAAGVPVDPVTDTD